MKWVISFLVLTILFLGCSPSESASHRRGKLSDAVNAASDNNSGDRTVNAEFQEPQSDTDSPPLTFPEQTTQALHNSGFSDTVVSLQYQYKNIPQSKKEYLDSVYQNDQHGQRRIQEQATDEDQPFLFGLKAATGFLSSNEFYGMTSAGLNIPGELENGIYGEIGADISFAPLQRTSRLSHSIDNGVILFELNGQVLFPTTPQYTFIGQYFLLGGGVNIMLWNYKNPIKAPVYTSNRMLSGYDVIDSDQLKGIDLFAGIGFDLTQRLPIHFIVEFKPGVIIWTGTTQEGFDNDIFANFAYLQMCLKVNFGSR